MTAIQMNEELLNNMSIIAEDDNLLKRAAKYMRKLVAEKEADPTLLSKEEFFARVEKARKQAEQGQVHRIETKDELNQFLNSI